MNAAPLSILQEPQETLKGLCSVMTMYVENDLMMISYLNVEISYNIICFIIKMLINTDVIWCPYSG